MTMIEGLQAYLIIGLILWLAVNLLNGTMPKLAELVIFSVTWPLFLVGGIVQARKRKQADMAEAKQDHKADRKARATKRAHPRDFFTPRVAEFQEAIGVHMPDAPEFEERTPEQQRDLREVISCLREVAQIAREKSKKYDGKCTALQRAQLVTEEAHELFEAIARGDAPHVASEGCDLMYVTLGSLLTFGLGKHVLPMFDEVHQANMSKFDPETGAPFYDDSGKATKGPFYKKPNLRRVMNDVEAG